MIETTYTTSEASLHRWMLAWVYKSHCKPSVAPSLPTPSPALQKKALVVLHGRIWRSVCTNYELCLHVIMVYLAWQAWTMNTWSLQNSYFCIIWYLWVDVSILRIYHSSRTFNVYYTLRRATFGELRHTFLRNQHERGGKKPLSSKKLSYLPHNSIWATNIRVILRITRELQLSVTGKSVYIKWFDAELWPNFKRCGLSGVMAYSLTCVTLVLRNHAGEWDLSNSLVTNVLVDSCKAQFHLFKICFCGNFPVRSKTPAA